MEYIVCNNRKNICSNILLINPKIVSMQNSAMYIIIGYINVSYLFYDNKILVIARYTKYHLTIHTDEQFPYTSCMRSAVELKI